MITLPDIEKGALEANSVSSLLQKEVSLIIYEVGDTQDIVYNKTLLSYNE